MPLLLLLGLWLGLNGSAWGQRRPLTKSVPRPAQLALDTARTSQSGDSLRVSAAPKGDIETTVHYVAKDSIQFDVKERIAHLYTKAKINYGTLSLEAARISIDYNKNLLSAEGAPDSTGKIRDRPIFKDKDQTYQAGRIAYNFKTKKGKIAEAVTQQGEGYVHAEVVKKNALNEVFGRNGSYTTCNLEHPHFYINASKMKVIPREKVVTGPFNLVIGDIPTPLGFLFGYFPTPGKKRASGLILPTFGQTTDRGFFLRNGGYYWAASEYVGVRLTGEVYSGAADQFGGWGAQADVQYRKRYAYNGSFNASFSQRPESQILRSTSVSLDQPYVRPPSPRTFWISWNHSPQPRPGGGQFRASVSLGSQAYNVLNSFDTQRYLSSTYQSNIGYSKVIRNSPFNYSIQASQSQNTGTGEMNVTLPDFTVGVARQYPYEWLGLTPRGRFYEQFSLSYDLQGQNRLTNVERARQLTVDGTSIPLIGGTSQGRRIPVNINNVGNLFRNAESSLVHRFGISLGSYTLLKHISFSPSVSYGDTWYTKSLKYKYDPLARAVRIDTAGFGRVWNFAAGASASTNIYGLYVIKGKKVEAIRHKISPSITYSHSPNYRKNESFYDKTDLFDLRDNNGRLLGERRISRFEGFGSGVPGGRASNLLTFRLQNQVEMKVRAKKDTTGNTPFEKVSLIDDLGFGTTYDFEASEFRLGSINGSFRTQIARKLNFQLTGIFDAYQRDSANNRINRFLFDQKKWRLVRLDRANLSITYQFNPEQRKANQKNTLAPNNTPVLGEPQSSTQQYEEYVDFSIPWTLNSSFSASYFNQPPVLPRAGEKTTSSLTTVTLNVNGSVKLTDKLRFGYSSGYDFRNRAVSYTSLDFYRDLHCWEISGSWIPFGQRQGYSFTIAAKSSLLQDLKLSRNRSFYNR
ncbi:putative LPS assembly protein LptD [Hymenobacter sp. BT730]|uniref:putative LPS assembly protein LptD n=1 Tax=Hymenobacter sp. BT730 TaxID=3063332 RepID=UPI0026DFE144|nr:putative LPS assembly protein LptD [Hymenobacter sp. BT730]